MSGNLEPLVLHAHGTAPNPYKIAAALEFLNVPYEVKLWQFGDAKNGVKGPVFTKINENGRVPALEDPNTGVVSWESGAVMDYILRVYDKQNTLGPRGNSVCVALPRHIESMGPCKSCKCSCPILPGGTPC
ncbi:Glutathione S-transferase-like protein OpS6 [Fulvia fulva]|uniref:Glutathione S-transferase-like protein OpS6 n=1 Tax=Passalora fulva TaxID=5499 RepID=A0A9Q8UUR9_PASFU|nr:Glutathione S-transferase-like protein OpS6 [Fulvia fulva]KAK4615734.1 Glutathione S-transferase-like protein OpS6 [Fulvia fulva]KAK4617397.1 Glutathione S-transferase-like protein OpS6 [Fulvia fulva]UJO23231.1 Glutathione S-transferase-like protein OpS6 [Fulvia fulva]WPV19226.1 Glutathione S-transferase-like protein OpS6 [Fulvia fulva]WPV34291.1 Glutathione S-transferase-like protein OpS6 [Fulvia fulva]